MLKVNYIFEFKFYLIMIELVYNKIINEFFDMKIVVYIMVYLVFGYIFEFFLLCLVNVYFGLIC